MGDGDHRCPARGHDHECRSHPGHGCGADRRQRHPYGAPREQRDVSRDRVLAAVRGRGGRMSERPGIGRPPGGNGARPGGAGVSGRPLGPAGPGGPGGAGVRPGMGGPGARRGPGMMGMMGMPAEKPKNFRDSFARLLRQLRPEAPLILLFLAGVYILSSIFSWMQAYIMAGVTQRTVYRLRRDVDRKLGRLPLRYFDSHPRGDTLSRVTNDIDNIGQTLQQSLTQLITSLLTVVGVLILMLTISAMLVVLS